MVNPRLECLTLDLGLWIQGKPKHVKTSKDMRNDHRMSHLMDLSGIQTLKLPKTLKRPMENRELKP